MTARLGTALFSVEPIAGHRIVRVTLAGSLTLNEVQQLAIDQADLVRVLAYRPNMFDALINATASPIQQIAVAEALHALADRPDFSPARLALVHGNGPVKMQIRRLHAQRQAVLFADETEALAWLSRPVDA